MKHRLRRPQTSTSSGHAHDIPGWLLAATGLCIAGLLAGVAIVGWLAVATNNRLDTVEQYIQGKGEQRDRENTALQEQIRRSLCDLLDQLPQGGLLDLPRAKYGCGPGLPLDQLPPDVQGQVRSGRAQPPAATAQAAAPTPAAQPSPAPPRPTTTGGAEPTGTTEPTPAPPAPPTTGPLDRLLCDALGVCLEVP